MKQKTAHKKVFVVGQNTPPATLLNTPVPHKNIWKWGPDNRLPEALAVLARSSTIHRRIINDKADYISGAGLTVDEYAPSTARLINLANPGGQSLRTIIQRIALDRCLFGNAFLEIVTNPQKTKLALFHQDATKCRLTKDNQHVIIHHDWKTYNPREARTLPLYPLWETSDNGKSLRAVIHYKDYEPMFEHYGLPKYIAGLGASAIVWKTDQWNISRLDNAFQPSGVMVLDGDTDSEQEAMEIAKLAEERFAGKPGQVMFLVKNGIDNDTTKFVPITTSSDGDWKSLHDQAVSDIIIAHSWFRTLSGMEYASGFSADRVQHEYNIALNTLIRVEQQEIIEPVRALCADIFAENTQSLDFINKPPFDVKPAYMRVWEARKADGYDYDPNDPAQQLFLAQV